MYKILIADDEKITLDAITFIINKNLKDIQCETARSGREAIDKSDTFNPNIIIMDIKMPGINGIEAIKAIKSKAENVYFIIISAYEQFEFAKEAVELGVIAYLLKPINKSNLIQTVQKCMAKIYGEKQKRQKDIEDMERYENMLPLIEDSFIYSIFIEDQPESINKYKQILSIDEDGGCIIVLEFHSELGVYDHDFYSYVKNLMEYKCRCFTGPIVINRMVAFVPEEKGTEYEKRLNLINFSEYIIKKIKSHVNDIDVSIGIGSFKNFDELNTSYKEALRALSFTKNNEVNHIKDIERFESKCESYPQDEIKKLIYVCSIGDEEDAVSIFDKIYSSIYSKVEGSFEKLRNSIFKIIMLFYKNIDISLFNKQSYTSSISEFMKCSTSCELEAWCRNNIKDVCSDIKNEKERDTSKIIVKAKKYIYDNYDKDITLDEIAKVVSVSPYYFSRLFKEETNENYIDYLTSVRIKKAKYFMESLNMSVKEICYKIGYNDPNYFSRLFKKIEKITPTEYMKSIHNC